MGTSVIPDPNNPAAAKVNKVANTAATQPLPSVGAVSATANTQVPAPQQPSAATSTAAKPLVNQQQDVAGIVPISSSPVPSVGPVSSAPVQQNAGGYQTAPLINTANGGNMSAYGDAGNSFRGVVSDQGGGYGIAPGGSQDAATAIRTLESVTGAQGAQFGDLSKMSPADIDSLTKQMGLIANRDPAGIQAGLTSTNPLVKETAERYARNAGIHPEQVAQQQQATSQKSRENAAMAQGYGVIGGDTIYDPSGGWNVDGTPAKVLGKLSDPNFDPSKLAASGNGAPGINPDDQTRAITETPYTSPIAGNWTPEDPSQWVGPTAMPDVLKGPQAPSAPSWNAPGSTAGAAPGSPSLPTTGPVNGNGSPGSASPALPATASGNVGTKTTDPNNALTGQTLSRAGGIDRFKLAQDQVDAWDAGTQPQFDRDLRQATRMRAGKGQLNTGMLRSDYGNITNARDTQRNSLQKSYLTDALDKTIADQFGDVGVAERQQGFQAGQQRDAFSQAMQQAMGEDTLTGNSFERALQAAMFGYQGNPSDTFMGLADTFGRNATSAGTAAVNYGNTSASAGSPNPYQAIIDRILAQYGGGGSTATPVPDAIPLPAGAS